MCFYFIFICAIKKKKDLYTTHTCIRISCCRCTCLWLYIDILLYSIRFFRGLTYKCLHMYTYVKIALMSYHRAAHRTITHFNITHMNNTVKYMFYSWNCRASRLNCKYGMCVYYILIHIFIHYIHTYSLFEV